MSDLVSRWFGNAYSRLHPVLQELYSEGGILKGVVALSYGGGIAGWLGRKWAAKQGLNDPGKYDFQLQIYEQGSLFIWDRQFGDAQLLSRFKPIGTITDGYWLETLGPLSLFLNVEIIDSGWHWRIKKAKLSFVRLPLFLFPDMEAHKIVREDMYIFKVSFSYPVLGKLFSYEGKLRRV
ncbi:MAG: DUF4166 domain-containing protein [Sneathiellales bacterium]|nr:DUF4166 domain-containing protein [Sneathiellales bacterium]